MPQQGLGLGLGLNAQQQQRVRKATKQGTLDQLIMDRPKLGKKLQSAATAGGKQQQNWLALGQKNAANMAQGAPATGAGGAKGAGAPAPPSGAAAPPAAPPAGAPGAGAGGAKGAPPKAPATFEQGFDTALGAGASKKFGPMDWHGPDPIETARAAGQRGLESNLAEIRNRYAQSGFGMGGREALAEGQATGDFATKFGDIAAERGLADRENSLTRLANMMQGAGAQDLQAQQLAMQMNQQLLNAGTGATAVGANEQQIPNADLFTTLLTNMSQGKNFGQGAQKQPSK